MKKELPVGFGQVDLLDLPLGNDAARSLDVEGDAEDPGNLVAGSEGKYPEGQIGSVGQQSRGGRDGAVPASHHNRSHSLFDDVPQGRVQIDTALHQMAQLDLDPGALQLLQGLLCGVHAGARALINDERCFPVWFHPFCSCHNCRLCKLGAVLRLFAIGLLCREGWLGVCYLRISGAAACLGISQSPAAAISIVGGSRRGLKTGLAPRPQHTGALAPGLPSL